MRDWLSRSVGAILVLAVWTSLGMAAAPIAPRPGATALVPIPAGEFTMGREGSTEMPPHRVKVDAFLLDEHEVTNAQYQAFCAATGAPLPVFWGLERFRCGEAWPDHPVVGVSQSAARKYAEWAGKRLPTEAEWEYAARAGSTLRFSTVDTLTIAHATYKKTEPNAPTPVKSYAPNAWGLYDMIGNVREWTSDRFGAVIPAASLVPEDGDLAGVVPRDNPTGPEKGPGGVVKGGGWFSGASCNAVYVRNVMVGSWGDFNVGFRCAADVGDGGGGDE